MSQFPIYYPPQESEGRDIVIFAFKDEQKKALQSHVMKQLSSALTLRQGSDVKKDGLKLFFADFAPKTTASSLLGTSCLCLSTHRATLRRDQSHSRTDNREIVPNGGKVVSYTFKATGGPTSTPQTGYYLINLLRCQKQNLPILAAAMDAYSRGVYHCGTFKMIFNNLITAEEDPELIMSLQGFPSERDAMFYFNASPSPYLGFQ
jgi:hypothetical protein